MSGKICPSNERNYITIENYQTKAKYSIYILYTDFFYTWHYSWNNSLILDIFIIYKHSPYCSHSLAFDLIYRNMLYNINHEIEPTNHTQQPLSYTAKYRPT